MNASSHEFCFYYQNLPRIYLYIEAEGFIGPKHTKANLKTFLIPNNFFNSSHPLSLDILLYGSLDKI